MLETLRGYGSRLLAEAGERNQAAAALARYALGVAGQAAAALQTGAGEQAAARWLDAEDATTRQALAWALDHDPDTALRLALALAPWWLLRCRPAYPVLDQAAGHAAPGSEAWCAAQFWLGWMAENAADPAGALAHFTAIRDAAADRPPSRALAHGLAGRSFALAILDRLAEAADEGRRALALARNLGSLTGEAHALQSLAVTAYYAGDFGRAVQLARQIEQIAADLPAMLVRASSTVLTWALIEAGDLAAAEASCTAWLAQAREMGDWSLSRAQVDMAALDLLAGRLQDAARHMRESIQTAARHGNRTDMLNALDGCGYLCEATGRHAEAITVWTARDALRRQTAFPDPPIIARRRDEPLCLARAALGEDRARAAEDRGAAMSQAAATEYALLLTAPGPLPETPTAGLAGLSGRERELVVLVAQGRTDAQIAAQLFISPRTVHSHLDRIRDKTGCRRRADLTRLALTAGLV